MILIPKQLQDDNFRFIKIRTKQKAPFENSWQKNNNYKYDDKLLQSHIKLDGNYGIVTGYGNLCVIDFDNEEYQEKLINKLPETFIVRSGGGLKHLYYYIDNPESFKILDDDKTTILDFQGIGKQIVCSGSIHPNGNKYEVIENKKIATIKLEEIKSLFYSTFNKKWLPKHWNIIDLKQYRKENNNDIVNEIKRKYTIKDLLNDQNINTNKNPTKCPLHSSKGGKSLGFDDEVWHCFHCEEKGDVISLYQLIYGLDFKQTLKELSNKLDIEYTPFNKKRFSNGIKKSIDRISQLQEFLIQNPVFYDTSKIWYCWSHEENMWIMVDETDILNVVRIETEENTTNSSVKTEILEGLKQLGRLKKPKNPPLNWIQFKNAVYDINTGKSFPPSPDYFFSNPIEWNIGEKKETPIMDKLFTEWVGEENKHLLYEIIAYCLYRDYPIHRIFCFTGGGRNGKSRYLELIKRFIGSQNTTSTELDILINNRFESAKLYKKLVCQLGETNDTALQNTALLKKLCGQDTIGYEFKNKNPFDDINYSKILIATNNLPTTLDKSDGFYRRWLIIDFPNQFPEGKDILASIPSVEYENLAFKCMQILGKILDNGKFTNEPSIEEKMKIYEEKSNPLNSFIKNNCEEDINFETPFHELYSDYIAFLSDRGYSNISKKKFSNMLKLNDFHINKKHVIKNDGSETTWNFVVGIRLIPIPTDTDNTVFSTLFPYEELVEKCVSLVSVGIGETDLIRFFRREIENFEVSKLFKVLDKMKEDGKIIEIPKGVYKLI